MPRKRIYISSTYDDLLSYRRTAASIIEDCGHLPVDSYVAGAKPTVEQCLADVDSCEVFVGIVGLRYGWVPRDGDPRSITHREFDRSAGKTRLAFLMLDKHVELAEPIRRFRGDIPDAALPVVFADLDDFSAALRKALRERVGIEPSFPPLLPFFCNRSDQYERVNDRLWERRQNGDKRMRIFVVHADALQSGPQFVEVLQYLLRDFPATRDSEAPLAFEFDWPRTFDDAQGFRRRVQQALAERVLNNRHAALKEIEQCLREVAGPVLIHTYLSTSEYQQTGPQALTEFCRFWQQWIDLQRVQPLIIVLRIEYELPRPTLLSWAFPSSTDRSNRAIRGLLKNRGNLDVNPEICEILDELPRVPVDEAIRWSHREQVRERLRGVGQEPQIRAIYQDKFAREPEGKPRMDPLAKELAALLKGRA